MADEQPVEAAAPIATPVEVAPTPPSPEPSPVVVSEPPPASPPPLPTPPPPVSEVPPSPPVVAVPPTPEPQPEVDLATLIIRVCDEYKPRLVAMKQGLFRPGQLVNGSWMYYPALAQADRAYLDEKIVENFRHLEAQLLADFRQKIAALIDR